MDRPAPALPPHPVIAGHYADATERVGYIRRLFDESAPAYDRINAWMSLRTGDRYRREALARAGLGAGLDAGLRAELGAASGAGRRVLDLACGTGVMARHAQDLVWPHGLVLALDPSLPMLAQAQRRGVRLRIGGIAEALPLADQSVDFVSMGYALRHVADLQVGFAEMFRVLAPGGRLLILEMVPPRSRLGYALTKVYLKYLVPGLTALVTRNAQARRLMRYYWETVDRCVPPQVVLAALQQAGFAGVQRRVMFGLFSEYQARRPANAA